MSHCGYRHWGRDREVVKTATDLRARDLPQAEPRISAGLGERSLTLKGSGNDGVGIIAKGRFYARPRMP